jgi:hypothetical protein
MAELDYEGETASIQRWLVRQLPQARSVEVFWFAFWDVTVGFELRGASQWSRDPEDWEWWYHDDFHGDDFESDVLNRMHSLAASVDDPTKSRRKEGGVWELMDYLLTIGYVGLAAAQAFRQTDPHQLLDGHKERWVVTGFPDAVYGLIVGKVTPQGFSPFNPSS